MEWVRVTIPASLAAQRGGAGSLMRGLPKELTISYDTGREGTVQSAEMIWEREVDGEPAVTYIQPEVNAPPADNWGGWVEPPLPAPLPPPVPVVLASPPPILIAGQQWLAIVAWESYYGGDNVYILGTENLQDAGVGTVNWWQTKIIAGSIANSWALDSQSPLYVGGSGAVNCYIATPAAIYKVVDIFGTCVATSIYTFAASVSTHGLRTIQCSIAEDWIVCHSHYGKYTPYGSSIIYSRDGGATWSDEIWLSTDYDSYRQRMSPGLYLSSKTLGFAITFAYTSIGDVIDGSPFKTEDWGATWTEITDDIPMAPNVGQSLGNGFHVPWFNNPDDAIAYYAFVSNTHYPDAFLSSSRAKLIEGTVITDVSPADSTFTNTDGSPIIYRPGAYDYGDTAEYIDTYIGDRNYIAMVCIGDSDDGETYQAIFISDDGGTTWTLSMAPTFYGPLTPTGVKFSVDDPNVLVAWGQPNVVWLSTDFGATWIDCRGDIALTRENVLGIIGGPT